ncbi:unnamed protein product [Leptosia nina]|uniref:Uncharacterized protein n=1 Tax=Leptosia nina TaxID=320188 RepID=A0AAV1J303_9NEOP
MVVVLDVDKFLNRRDFLLLLHGECEWPWEETHFLRAQSCGACHAVVNPHEIMHIRMAMSHNDIRLLLKAKHFWCECGHAVYDHYPPDECASCA